MERKQFIKGIITGAVSMTTLSAFNRFTDDLREQGQLTPVLFYRAWLANEWNFRG